MFEMSISSARSQQSHYWIRCDMNRRGAPCCSLCSRHEGDSQGKKTNTYQPFHSGYLNHVSENSGRDWTELPFSFYIKLSSDSQKAHCRQYEIKRQTITQETEDAEETVLISIFVLVG